MIILLDYKIDLEKKKNNEILCGFLHQDEYVQARC
jgi:hypothetical protein